MFGLMGIARLSGHACGAAFDPLSLFADGELGWLYDPSDASSLFQLSNGTTAITASSDPVGYMADLSGRGNHQLQATAGKRPLYIEDGALRALRFDGVASAMSVASANLTSITKATLVMCVKQNSATGAQVVMEHGTIPTSPNGGIAAYFNNTNSGSIGGGLGKSSFYVFNTGSSAAVPRVDVVSITYDPAGATADDKCAIRINGASINETQSATAGTVTAAFGSLSLYLGARTGASLYADMDLYFMALVGRELTAGELANLEAYAAEKGGIGAEYDITPSSFTDTGATVDSGGYYLTSAFASFDFVTTAESLDVFSRTTIYGSYPTYAKIGVYVDGVYNQSISFSANGPQKNTITLPAGTKTISLVNGLQSKPSGSVLGSFVTRVHASVPITQTNLTPSNRMVIYGDSITVGSDASPLMQNAWPLLVRNDYRPDSVAMEAWGFRSLYDDCVDGTARAAFVAKIVAYSPASIWLAIGTNDYGLNKWSAAAFGTAYAALLDDLHAALPSAVIYCQTPILRNSEVANGSGSTLSNYRTQIGTAVSTRSAYCTLVDGTAFMTTASLGDSVHPNTAGHALYAAAVIAELGI